ncbi:MAG: M56 family metallopeptidase [Candidatus Daviesbacteria bacterium]|nr:M56 family metallopeptidase [Candidatus Daviesbacteria bacterium]
MKRINYGFYILVFAVIAVSVTVILLVNKVSPLIAPNTSKPFFLCQKFISHIMFEIPRSLPGILILTVGVVLGIGLLSFLAQLIKTRLLLRKLLTNRRDITRKLALIITPLGLQNKVILVEDNNLFSFCFGIFYPRILITTGLLQSLTGKELEAVLLHEESHLVSRDPVKVLIGKTFSSMFFFLPLFADLRKNMEAFNELLADQWTISRQKSSFFLRGALKKILATPQFNLDTVSNVSGSDFFEIRIHRLKNPGIKHKFRFSLISMVTTLLFVLVSWFLLQTPASAYHMDSKSDSGYLLCSENQCHSGVKQSTSYIPASLHLAEKTCY